MRLRPMLRALLCATLLCACRSPGAVQPGVFDRAMRAASFDLYWQALDEGYPYFAKQGVDWEHARLLHRPRALAAESRRDFYFVLAAMLSELQDRHLDLFVPAGVLAQDGVEYGAPDLRLDDYGGRWIVEAWPEGPRPTPPLALADRPFPHAEVLSVEGVRLGRGAGLSPHLVRGLPGRQVQLELGWSDGSTTHWTVACMPRPREEPADTRPPRRPEMAFAGLLDARLHAGVGYLRVDTFDADAYAPGRPAALWERMDAATDSLLDAQVLILDLRFNQGGDGAVMERLLARLLPEPALYGRLVLGPDETAELSVRPRPPIFRGPILVLTSAATASVAEHCARALRQEVGAVLIGETTAGAEAALHHISGPDGSMLSFGRWPLLDELGHGFQGEGLHPDHHLGRSWELLERLGVRGTEELTRRLWLERCLELLDRGDELEAFWQAFSSEQARAAP